MKYPIDHENAPLLFKHAGFMRLFLILISSALITIILVTNLNRPIVAQTVPSLTIDDSLSDSHDLLENPESEFSLPPETSSVVESLSMEAASDQENAFVEPTKAAMINQQQVFIYHSHNRESWLPELRGEKNPNKAYHSTKNVTLLGGRLEEQLQKSGVGAVHSTIDYPTEVTAFKYSKSYDYSKKTIQTTLNKYPEIDYWFDIHRDSQRRAKTTIRINGLDYAQIYFVIGERNPNWKRNLEFAQQLHDRINEIYPGLSKGVYTKNIPGSNSEYNQSHSPNSSLIEIGGVDNTLKEAYRSTDILSKAIIDQIQNQKTIRKQNIQS